MEAADGMTTIIDLTGEATGAIGAGYELPATLLELHLSQNRLARIERLEGLSNLVVLVLRGNLIKEIDNLHDCTALRELDLYENELSQIQNLEALVELRSLDLSFNSIRSLAPLRAQGLGRLERLYVAQNKLDHIEALDSLAPSLRLLELGSNRIRAVEGLDDLVHLTELHLGRNKIAELGDGLAQLTSLRILGLSSNRLRTLDGLGALEALEELYVAHNGLSTLADLPHSLAGLRVLDAAGNRIEVVASLRPFPLLEDLWLNDNQIGEMAAAAAIAEGARLQTLYLEGNPLAATPTYAEQVLAFAPPSLRQLDAIALMPDWSAKVARGPPAQPAAVDAIGSSVAAATVAES
jgi:protein phosphatase 1 regulatory subunit 7